MDSSLSGEEATIFKLLPRACLESGDTPDQETALRFILACQKKVARKEEKAKDTKKVVEKLLETTSWTGDTAELN